MTQQNEPPVLSGADVLASAVQITDAKARAETLAVAIDCLINATSNTKNPEALALAVQLMAAAKDLQRAAQDQAAGVDSLR